MNQSSIPLSLYIHTPWCIKKCPYCDFNSHKLTGELPETAYIDALLADLQLDLHYVQSRPIQSIFIGGGTPSLLSAKSYQRLFTGLQQQLTFAEDIEITLEANPGSVEASRFKAYREIGINRLSLGVQSFNDKHLSRLGRIHGADEAKRAIDTVRHAGFNNFNIDIMHGLPNQTTSDALSDLKTGLSFSPSHFSWYQLTIEPNTRFYKEQPTLPSESVLAEIEQAGMQQLKAFNHYEISAFAKPGKESRHNLNYWTFGDYLGIGAGAHSKLSDSAKSSIRRLQKKRLPTQYLTGDTLAKSADLSADDRLFEFMLNYLRLHCKIPFTIFEQRTFLDRAMLIEKLAQAKHLALMEYDIDSCWLTAKGRRFSNDVQALFLDASN